MTRATQAAGTVQTLTAQTQSPLPACAGTLTFLTSQRLTDCANKPRCLCSGLQDCSLGFQPHLCTLGESPSRTATSLSTPPRATNALSPGEWLRTRQETASRPFCLQRQGLRLDYGACDLSLLLAHLPLQSPLVRRSFHPSLTCRHRAYLHIYI